MNITKLSETFSVAGQIFPDDVADIAAAGFKTIICNRPDGEGMDQADFALVEGAAKQQGIAIHYVPVVAGMMTMDDVVGFDGAMEEAVEPVLAYCRSGARSTQLHSVWQREKASGRL
jgi:uncharacterized protein (TIGR01244 family)